MFKAVACIAGDPSLVLLFKKAFLFFRRRVCLRNGFSLEGSCLFDLWFL